MILPTTISFPGLGIEPFTLSKVAFSVGSIQVRWYGIVIVFGIIMAFLYAAWRGKRNEGIIFDDVIDIGLFTVIFGVIGARLYYVLSTIKDGYYESLLDVIALWDGGLAIYGGIIGGCLGIFTACKIKKFKWRRAFDMIAPGVMIAQAIGRWGNFFNGEAHGYLIGETTRYYLFGKEFALSSGEGTLFHTLRMGVSHNEADAHYFFYHPTFFYECLWNILGFVLINLFYKRKKYDGQIALMYFTWYGFGRMFIEGFRSDSLFIPGTQIRISQTLGLLCFVAGTALLLVLFFRKTSEPVFAASNAKTVVAATADESSESVESLEPVETAEQPLENAENDLENNKTPKSEEQNDGNVD